MREHFFKKDLSYKTASHPSHPPCFAHFETSCAWILNPRIFSEDSHCHSGPALSISAQGASLSGVWLFALFPVHIEGGSCFLSEEPIKLPNQPFLCRIQHSLLFYDRCKDLRLKIVKARYLSRFFSCAEFLSRSERQLLTC